MINQYVQPSPAATSSGLIDYGARTNGVTMEGGRENGICENMFDKYGCQPQLVVISDDYKQYDTQETARYYASKAAGITNFRSPGANRWVLTTRRDGDIHFTWDKGGCTVY